MSTPIPLNIRREIEKNPKMRRCIHEKRLLSSLCSPGRVTWEHAWKYAGQRINEAWAILGCCWKHNVGVSGKEKRFNQLVALRRATPEDLAKYPKVNWEQERAALEEEFSMEPGYPFSSF